MLEINEEMLLQLGCTNKKDCDTYHLRTESLYCSQFVFFKNGNVWTFDSGKGLGGMVRVTDLAQCFHIVAEENYEAGKRSARLEIRRALGLE